jgi:hypothetical protein
MTNKCMVALQVHSIRRRSFSASHGVHHRSKSRSLSRNGTESQSDSRRVDSVASYSWGRRSGRLCSVSRANLNSF